MQRGDPDHAAFLCLPWKMMPRLASVPKMEKTQWKHALSAANTNRGWPMSAALPWSTAPEGKYPCGLFFYWTCWILAAFCKCVGLRHFVLLPGCLKRDMESRTTRQCICTLCNKDWKAYLNFTPYGIFSGYMKHSSSKPAFTFSHSKQRLVFCTRRNHSCRRRNCCSLPPLFQPKIDSHMFAPSSGLQGTACINLLFLF